MFRTVRLTAVGIGLMLGLTAGLALGQEDEEYEEDVALPRSAVSTVRGQSWALLIAVDDYFELGKLQYASNDMKDLQAKLQAAGFAANHVVLMEDKADAPQKPFKANITKQLAQMLSQGGPNDLVIVAASMHGVSIKDKSYLCPIETTLRDVGAGDPQDTGDAGAAEHLIAVDGLYEQLGKCPARRKLLLLDACRNTVAPADRRAAQSALGEVSDFVQSLRKPAGGLWILASCARGQTSLEDAKLNHGVFMHFLLEGLDGLADSPDGNNDGQVQLFELFNYANRSTSLYALKEHSSPQVPVMQGEGENFTVATAPSEGRRARLHNGKSVELAAMLDLANSFTREKKFEEALRILDKLAEVHADDKEVHAYRALAHRENGSYEKAMADFQKAGQSLHLMVTQDNVALAMGTKSQGSVRRGEQVEITSITNEATGQWFWVNSVNQDQRRRGWVQPQTLNWSSALANTYLQPTDVRPFDPEETYSRLEQLEETRQLINSVPYAPHIPSPLDYVPGPVRGLLDR